MANNSKPDSVEVEIKYLRRDIDNLSKKQECSHKALMSKLDQFVETANEKMAENRDLAHSAHTRIDAGKNRVIGIAIGSGLAGGGGTWAILKHIINF